jgi:hypothetical protein
LAGAGAWLSVACIAVLLMEPYAPGSGPGSAPVRDGVNLLSDLSLLPLPLAWWLHDGDRKTVGGYRALVFGGSGVFVWIISDLLSASGPAAVSTALGAIASGLLGVWVLLVCRRGVASGAMPKVLAGLGAWAVPGLLLMAGFLLQAAFSAPNPSPTDGPPPVASLLVMYLLVLGPFWVWLVMTGSYLLSYSGVPETGDRTP